MAGFSSELTRISIGGATPHAMIRLGLVADRSLYAVCTDLKTTFLTSAYPQLSVNLQFALVQSSHLAGFSRELTRISIGGIIPHAVGMLGLVADRSLYVVCTDLKPIFLTSVHTQLSVNMQFALVQSSHLVGFNRELTRISIGGAIPKGMEMMGMVARRSLYAVCTC